ncbi:MAG TPA: efflux RND transporter periplasmic adaptor subunit, partial [Planctomycetota bacterium]|nr:efflux RND transporter periplasmic adaptor subunit [Planctomycetota bacterium]
RTDRLKAEVDLEAADAALERVRAIVAAHALPAKEELAASEERKRAELALRLADARLDSLHLAGADGERPNELVIASPRDGAVVEKTVAPHQVVACDATPLMVVADLSSLWVLADVFETDAVEVSEGAEAEITSPALPNGAIAARVESVSAVVDPVRHTVPIRMEVDNAAGALRPNAYASVRFATRPQPNAVAIPATALVSDGARQHVYVCENGSRFVRRDIVAAATTAGTTTVLSGLAAGESVVVEGAILLDNELASAR